jgi:phosphoglycolate phosphatase-like HAD superfamily hydrolase
MKQILLVLIFAFHGVLHCAAIHEISSLDEVIRYVNQDTLVIFDIDNTLLHPNTDLGSDQWLCHKIQELTCNGIDHQQALQEMLPIYFHINRHIDLVPTEPQAADIVKLIQQTTNMVMCLTARSQPMIQVTHKQLCQNNFNFTFGTSEEHLFDLEHPCYFSHGVLFCASNDKGVALFALLDRMGIVPARVVIVDDKMRNIHALVKATDARNIECIGLRYGGCDHRVANYDSNHTQHELENFVARKPIN